MPLKRPTTTPLPDEIYDEWAPKLGKAEIKVLLYIVRRTLGFRKSVDAISLSQFQRGIVTRDGRTLDHGCGVTSRRSLVAALKSLEDKGLIRTMKSQASAGDPDITLYALWWEDDVLGGSILRPLPSSPKSPGWYPQDTEVVAAGYHGSSRGLPTTNSSSTHSQQDSETPRAQRVTQKHKQQRGRAGHEEPPARQTEGMIVWQSVLDDLRGVLTPTNYTNWFETTSVLGMEGNDLCIRVRDDFHYHWLHERLRHRIDDALRRTGHGDVHVTFSVAS